MNHAWKCCLALSACAGMMTLAGCAGSPDGADDSVALVRGTSTTELGNLGRCLDAAGFAVRADDVEAKTFGNGDAFHVVRFRGGSDEVRFTVVPAGQFVFTYDDADAATLDDLGCSIDAESLNENTARRRRTPRRDLVVSGSVTPRRAPGPLACDRERSAP